MIIPKKLKKGDTIGVVAPSNPIIGENIEELEKAKKILERDGYKVVFSKNIFSNANEYSATAKEKADDINEMFANKDIDMIWCAKGGENSNSVFDYLDFEIIRNNPKIIAGFSDITSIINVIANKTGLVTFSATNFKTVATDETDYSYKQAIARFSGENATFDVAKKDCYKTIKEGTAEGELIGGNLTLTTGLVAGKYKINFKNKILFLEELGYESDPSVVSRNLYFMKQNGVFDEINGLWIGNYEHISEISLEKIVTDIIGNEYNFTIIKSNNFGHNETKIAIPIGVKAKIDTNKQIKIELLEKCVK